MTKQVHCVCDIETSAIICDDCCAMIESAEFQAEIDREVKSILKRNKTVAYTLSLSRSDIRTVKNAGKTHRWASVLCDLDVEESLPLSESDMWKLEGALREDTDDYSRAIPAAGVSLAEKLNMVSYSLV